MRYLLLVFLFLLPTSLVLANQPAPAPTPTPRPSIEYQLLVTQAQAYVTVTRTLTLFLLFVGALWVNYTTVSVLRGVVRGVVPHDRTLHGDLAPLFLVISVLVWSGSGWALFGALDGLAIFLGGVAASPFYQVVKGIARK